VPLKVDLTTFTTDSKVMMNFNYINGSTAYVIYTFPTTSKKHELIPASYNKTIIEDVLEGLQPNSNYSISLKLFLQDSKTLLQTTDVTTKSSEATSKSKISKCCLVLKIQMLQFYNMFTDLKTVWCSLFYFESKGMVPVS